MSSERPHSRESKPSLSTGIHVKIMATHSLSLFKGFATGCSSLSTCRTLLSQRGERPVMEVHKEHVPEKIYCEFVEQMPQVCGEVVVERNDGAVLTARRTNKPASGEWFRPGSRRYKCERLKHAAHRVGRENSDSTSRWATGSACTSTNWRRALRGRVGPQKTPSSMPWRKTSQVRQSRSMNNTTLSGSSSQWRLTDRSTSASSSTLVT